MKFNEFIKLRDENPDGKNFMLSASNKFDDGETKNFNAEFVTAQPDIVLNDITWKDEEGNDRTGTLVLCKMRLSSPDMPKFTAEVGLNADLESVIEAKETGNVFGVVGYGKRNKADTRTSDRFDFRLEPFHEENKS